MKSTPIENNNDDDFDDIFGPSRSYPIASKNRPSMISAKYRQKEERRKVLKISINKLKKIEDPETILCRSVLINNTMKRLQREVRDEKIQKQQLNYPRCHPESHKTSDEAEMDVDDTLNTRKRSATDMDDCDGIIGGFYVPPTPRLLTCIDEDEAEAPVGMDEVRLKRARLDEAGGDGVADGADDFLNGYIENELLNDTSSRLRYITMKNEPDTTGFGCGHASLFNELQTTVYHNLIASLET